MLFRSIRLAFAVASHLDSDIMIVDEVLAVGDAFFQKRCLEKMDDVSQKEGRSILFVSHNISAVSALCNKCFVLEQGRMVWKGGVEEGIDLYLRDWKRSKRVEWTGEAGDENVILKHTAVESLDGTFSNACPIEITIEAEIRKDIYGLVFGFTLYSGFGYELAYCLYDDHRRPPCETVPKGKMSKKFEIPANTLAQGNYFIEVDIGIHNVKRIIKEEGKLFFSVNNTEGPGRRFLRENSHGASCLFRPEWLKNDDLEP